MALYAPAGQASQNYQIFVSNEKSGDVTVINGGDNQVLGTIPVGKRPRGIHVSPDGRTVYVALSGTPIAAPPQLDAKGNPIFQKARDDDDDEGVKADKSADAIGVVDVAQKKLTGKIPAGSDPEEFSLSSDGTKLYVSNEDVKAASVIDIATAKVEHIIVVGQEPEGVATSPDGKRFYVTCEAGGDVYAIDAASYRTLGHFKVNVRPAQHGVSTETGLGFIPSESTGELNVIDTVNFKVLKIVALPAGSRPMSVKVASNKIYVSNGRAGTVSVLDSHTYELLEHDQGGPASLGNGAFARRKISLHGQRAVRRCVRRRSCGQQGDCTGQSGREPVVGCHRSRYKLSVLSHHRVLARRGWQAPRQLCFF